MNARQTGKTNHAWRPIKIAGRNVKKFPSQRSAVAGRVNIVDEYRASLLQLFLLRHPQSRFNGNYEKDFKIFADEHFAGGPEEKAGVWFYFPWINTLTHYLEEPLHLELRTGRNRYLITEDEQNKYYNSTVSIAGLSVGSHVALTIVMAGGARFLRLADPDTISGDNLNRVRIGFQNVGLPKAVVVARQIFEINPYAGIKLFTEGVSKKNVKQFLADADVLVEEMDNPFWKLAIRVMARERHIPVIMGTDNGDGIIADVERFDGKGKLPILHGAVGELKISDLESMDPHDLPRIAAKIAGADLASPRMLHSVMEVGKSIYSWPQLGTAANLCGSAVAYLTREIVLGNKKINSGRYEINLDSIFQADYSSRREIKIREAARKKFFNAMRK